MLPEDTIQAQMISAFKCRAFAAERRKMAGRADGPDRDALTMADLWDSLARDNEAIGKRFKEQSAVAVPSGSLQAISRRLLWMMN